LLRKQLLQCTVPLNTCLITLCYYLRHPPPGGFHASDQTDDPTVRARYGAKIKASAVYQHMEKALGVHASFTPTLQ
jgi:hypothetical protein